MQISGQNFIEIVKQTFNAPNNDERAKNEAILSRYMQESSEEFAENCVREFQNANNNTTIRTIVGTVLRAALRPIDREKVVSIWYKLSPGGKEHLKTMSLTCLIDPNDQVKKAAAAIVAVVFVLDTVTDRTWGNLLNALTDNIGNSLPEIKRAAITTLGYICEYLNTDKITDLAKDQIDALLSGICIGITGFSEISLTAVIAMSNSIQFLSTTIQHEPMADYVFDLLINLLIKSSEIHDEELQRNVILCLGEIVKLVFLNFGKYKNITFQKVIESYQSGFDSVILAVNEFFMLVIKQEQNHKTNYMDSHWQILTQTALETLFKYNKQSPDDDESGLSPAPSIQLLLGAINNLYTQQSFPILLSFVGQHIESNEEVSKLTALMTFSSTLDTTPNEMAYSNLNGCFFSLVNYSKTGSPRIRLNAIRLLRKIAQFHTNVFLNDQNFPRAFSELARMFEISSNDDYVINMKVEICSCFEALASRADSVPNGKQLIAPFTENLFDYLLKNIQTNNNVYLIDTIFSTMFTFIEKIVELKQMGDYFGVLSDFLVNIFHHYNGSCKKQIIESLFINQNVVLTQLHRSGMHLEIKNKDSKSFLLDLFNFIANIFSQCGDIFSEGLVLMATIIAHEPKQFIDIIEAFIKDYVTVALRDPENFDLFKTGVESASLVLKGYPGQFEDFFRQYIPYFLDLLENNSLQKELKVVIFFIISDVVLHFPRVIIDNLDRILSLSELAFAAILHLQNTATDELLDFSEALKETLVDCYLCIIHGIYLNTNDKDVSIENSFQSLMSFMNLTCQPQLNPTIDYVKNCLSIIVDFYSKKQNLSLINIDVAKSLYHILSRYKGYGDADLILEYTEKKLGNL